MSAMRHRLQSAFKLAMFLGVALAARPAAAQPGVVEIPPEPAPAKTPLSDEATLKAAKIPTDGAGLIEFFRKRIEGADKNRLQALAVQLGDDVFQVREQASAQLVAAGRRAKAILEEATKSSDLEVATRARDCLRRIDEGATAMVVAAAARVLAQRKQDGATGILLAYLPSAEDDAVADEVSSALAALALRDGRPDPVLVAALTDKEPVKRAAAGVALCRAGAKGEMAAVRELLKDAAPTVRLRVGLALTAAGEKESLPVLIELLAVLPSRDTGVVEDLLYHVAGDKAPSGDGSTSETARRRYRDDWMKWWNEEGAKLDLAKLGEASKSLGYTLVLLLDQGKAMELDSGNRPRWTVEGLEFPLDVQALPGDLLLSAEHSGNRVTERDVKTGKVVWEYKITHPLVAQRLPNGSTFIASQTGALEVDRAGKMVWEYNPIGGETIMKAQKLRNGEVAMVTQLGVTRFVQLNRDGKTEKRSFPVNLHTSGGRIDVLPNGNVLVPENANNRVVEIEPAGPVGRVIWEVAIDSPVAAVRLANGHTMITSMNPGRGAVEVDRAGKEVWTYRAETRVTRALRR
jgi:HEAT repeats/PQQ-like domain